jgi:hypothetical protein
MELCSSDPGDNGDNLGRESHVPKLNTFGGGSNHVATHHPVLDKTTWRRDLHAELMATSPPRRQCRRTSLTRTSDTAKISVSRIVVCQQLAPSLTQACSCDSAWDTDDIDQ